MNLIYRMSSGVIFGVLFTLGLFFHPLQRIVPIIVCVATGIGTFEFFRLAKMKAFKAEAWLGCLVGCWMVVVGYHFGFGLLPVGSANLHPIVSPVMIIVFALLGSMGVELWRGGTVNFVARCSITFFGCFYVGLPMALAMDILHGSGLVDNSRFLIVFMILATWASDIGAYFIGRKFGKRHPFPVLSPGKTLEGVYGGIAGSILMALALMLVWPQVGAAMHWPRPDGLVLAALFAIIGVVGDLAESGLKRDAGVKDSGFDFTGHGGILDVIDSLLFTAPVFYMYWIFYYFPTYMKGAVP